MNTITLTDVELTLTDAELTLMHETIERAASKTLPGSKLRDLVCLINDQVAVGNLTRMYGGPAGGGMTTEKLTAVIDPDVYADYMSAEYDPELWKVLLEDE